VLAEVDRAEEEAAALLGASPPRIFLRVILPALTPAIGCGMLQSFARALAEFGSIVVVSGNIPHRTLTLSVLVFGEVESGRPAVAAAVSVVLLVLAFSLSMGTRGLRSLTMNRRARAAAAGGAS
jgi:sulfate transport system permease protein